MSKSIVNKVPLDADLKEMMKAINEMEDYSDDFINRASGSSMKLMFNLASYKAAAGYAAAVKTLNEKRPSAKVSKALIRPLFETVIGLQYNALREDDLYVLEELLRQSHKNKGDLEDIEEFMIEHEVDKVGVIHLSAIRARETKADKNIAGLQLSVDKILGGKKSDYTQKLNKQAQAIDKRKPAKKLEDAAFFNYKMLYPYWSDGVHLGASGTTSWIDLKGKKLYLNHSGDDLHDVKLAVWQAMAIFRDISVFTMKQFDLYDDNFAKKYQALIEKHRPN